jgi:hypothetical protein
MNDCGQKTTPLGSFSRSQGWHQLGDMYLKNDGMQGAQKVWSGLYRKPESLAFGRRLAVLRTVGHQFRGEHLSHPAIPATRSRNSGMLGVPEVDSCGSRCGGQCVRHFAGSQSRGPFPPECPAVVAVARVTREGWASCVAEAGAELATARHVGSRRCRWCAVRTRACRGKGREPGCASRD